MISRRNFVVGTSALIAGAIGSRPRPLYALIDSDAPIAIDLNAKTTAFPHFWEKAMGSDRTVVGLRTRWREDLIRAHRDTGMQSVRCHGLFDDEMGIAAAGASRLNFLYVDQIYDFMLDHGVRPFVELSFMPEALASSNNRIFAYRGNVSPPQNWQDWRAMVQAFTDHCVKRYGIAEVGGWKFEVWNEPNIAFWAGSQAEYFELYRQSALAIKDVDKRLQVGGPSTAQLDWIPELIQYCSGKGVPLDFVSSHVYPDDPQKHVFGHDNLYTFEQVIPRGVEQVKHQVLSSVMPNLPLWITEWSSQNPAFIADTIKNCIGLAEAMSYWTFSNDFEEGGVPSGIFNNTFGLIDQWGIARPSLHAFSFLHKLGETRLETGDGPVLATKRADGSIAVLVWNLISAKDAAAVANGNPMGATGGAGGKGGQDRTVRLRLNGLNGRKAVDIRQVSVDVGSAIPEWKKMGSPQYPSKEQIAQLRAAAELAPPQRHELSAEELSTFSIALPPNGVALLEFPK